MLKIATLYFNAKYFLLSVKFMTIFNLFLALKTMNSKKQKKAW